MKVPGGAIPKENSLTRRGYPRTPIAGSCPFVFREKLLGYFCDDDLLSFLLAVY
jgi:hypothetical protein